MSSYSRPILLTVVTPIARMAGRLENLRSWITNLEDLSIEVILVHDKQDQRTGSELASLALVLNDSRVVIIEGEFGGPGIARNIGLEAAHGDWVCFWDSDDIPQIDEFFAMLHNANVLKVECVVGGFTAQHDVTHARKVHLLTLNYLNEIALNPGIWRFAFKRTTLDNLRFSKLLMAEDQIFLANLGISDRKIHIHPKSVYTYFTGENFHSTRRKEALADLPKAIDLTLEILQEPFNKNTDFVTMLLSRQILTAIKKCEFQLKMKVIKSCSLELLSFPRIVFKSFLKSTWLVLLSRNSIL